MLVSELLSELTIVQGGRNSPLTAPPVKDKIMKPEGVQLFLRSCSKHKPEPSTETFMRAAAGSLEGKQDLTGKQK